MSSLITRVLCTLALVIAGSLLGVLWAKHQIALNVAYMREHWGWVCGTGLDLPLYFFLPIGAILGMLVSLIAWRLAVRLLDSRRAD
jgi:hypothetical protein